MKKGIIFLLIIMTGCSSIPKKDRILPVSVQKEKASLYLDRGHNEYMWGEFLSAAHLYSNAFFAAASVDWQDGMIRALVHASRSYDRIGIAELSKEYLDRASDLILDKPSASLNVLVLNRRTEWLFFNDSSDAALKKNDEAIDAADNVAGEDAGETWRIRASILKALKSYDLALNAVNRALDLDKKGNYIPELANDYYVSASIYSLMGQKEKAVESMNRALKNDKFIENTPGIAQDLYALGLIYDKGGETEKADHFFYRSYLVYTAVKKDSVPEKLLSRINGSPSGNLWRTIVDEF